MKLKAVVFYPEGAKILTNPPNLEDLKAKYLVVVNPDMTKVLGIPPHRWRYEGGTLVPKAEGRPAVSRRTGALSFVKKCSPLIYAALGAAIAIAIQTYL